jgi:hypothetical protein
MSNKHPAVGQYCVIRTINAGVHYGTVEHVDNTGGITLSASRRLWSWSGAFSLSEVSQIGIKSGKVACEVPLHYILGVIELLPCSAAARAILEKQPAAKT